MNKRPKFKKGDRVRVGMKEGTVVNIIDRANPCLRIQFDGRKTRETIWEKLCERITRVGHRIGTSLSISTYNRPEL